MMFRLKVVALVLTTLQFISIADASESLRVSMKKAIDMAIKSSEQVRIKKNESEKMNYRYEEARSGIYPHINGEATWNNYKKIPVTKISLPGMPPISMPAKAKYDASIGITATQVLWSFGKVSTAIKLANDAFKISEFDHNMSKHDVILKTKVAYYSTLLAKRSLGIARKSYLNAKRNKEILYKRFAFGRPPKADNIKMSADVAARIPALKDAQAQYNLAMKSLKTIIEVPLDKKIVLTDKFSNDEKNLNLNSLYNRLDRNNITFKLLRKNIELNDKIIDIKRADYLPTLGAFGSFQYTGSSNDKATIGGSDDFQKIAVVGVKLTFPIWNGGEKASSLKQAIVDRNNARVKLSQAQKGFNLELANAVYEYSALLDTYSANKDAVKLAKQLFKMTQTRFSTGKASITELNDAERMLTGQNLQKEATLFKLNTLIAKIQNIISTEGDL